MSTKVLIELNVTLIYYEILHHIKNKRNQSLFVWSNYFSDLPPNMVLKNLMHIYKKLQNIFGTTLKKYYCNTSTRNVF